jgi:hypothetical protein
VDFVVPVGFEPLAEHLLTVMMVVVLRLGGRKSRTSKSEKSQTNNHRSEKALYSIHVHG